MLSNYECIEKMKVNAENVRDRIEEAWVDWELIVFPTPTGRPIIVQGIEHKREDGLWFIEYDSEGRPYSIVGNLEDLISYMNRHHVTEFKIYEEV